MSGLSLETCTSNLKSVALTVLELLAFNAPKFRGSHPFQGLLTKYFLWDVKGKLCSKFFEDRSKTEFTILAVIAGRMDTGRTPDAKVNLYSVQCYTLHWTDNNLVCSCRVARKKCVSSVQSIIVRRQLPTHRQTLKKIVRSDWICELEVSLES